MSCWSQQSISRSVFGLGRAAVNCASRQGSAIPATLNAQKSGLMTEVVCVCKSCGSENVTECDAIMKLRAAQVNSEKESVVSALVNLIVCADCGAARFSLSPGDLALVRQTADGFRL